MCIDKGTYDAVSLHPDNSKERREEYIKQVFKILEPRGFLIITSCNWTEDELKTQFGTGKGSIFQEMFLRKQPEI